jgi:hypothetical protein
MDNGKSLRNGQRISIDSALSGLSDLHGNKVLSGNRKVPLLYRSEGNAVFDNFHFYPNPVSLSRITRGEPVCFEFDVYRECYVHVRIYDLAGFLVSDFPGERYLGAQGYDDSSSSDFTGRTYQKEWDCKNQKGVYISRGGYIAVAYVSVGGVSKKYFFKIAVQ